MIICKYTRTLFSKWNYHIIDIAVNENQRRGVIKRWKNILCNVRNVTESNLNGVTSQIIEIAAVSDRKYDTVLAIFLRATRRLEKIRGANWFKLISLGMEIFGL